MGYLCCPKDQGGLGIIYLELKINAFLVNGYSNYSMKKVPGRLYSEINI
jgi:hypothetical protein